MTRMYLVKPVIFVPAALWFGLWQHDYAAGGALYFILLSLNTIRWDAN